MTKADPAISRIEALVDGVPGWSPIDELFALFMLAYTAEAEGDILEIGAWCGRSTSALALAASQLTGVKVHAVDLFPERDDWQKNADGSYSLFVNFGGRRLAAYDEQTVWAEPFERDIAPIYQAYDGVLDAFNHTIARNGFVDVVEPWKGDLAEFAKNGPKNFRCRLAFIDGDHGFDAVCRDIDQVEQYLSDGGWICFDDAFSVYDGVDRAITDRVIRRMDVYERATQLTRKLFVARRRRSTSR